MLNESQMSAVDSTFQLTKILGGPGFGKTRVIAERISSMIKSKRYRPSEIVALTYTRNMASDLRDRIVATVPDAMPCTSCDGTGFSTGYSCGDCFGSGKDGFEPPLIGTLHSLASTWCKMALAGEIAGGDALMGLGWITKRSFGIAMPEDEAAIIDAVYRQFRKKVLKRDLKAGLRLWGRDLVGWPKHTAARQQLALRNLVRYDDLLTMLGCVLAQVGRPNLPRLSSIVRCLMVDESHDLTRQHWGVIELMRPDSITVVGDDGQRIFSFLSKGEELAGPSPFSEMMADRTSPVFKLEKNYRAQPKIVEACDAVRAALVMDGACTSMPAVAARDDEGGDAEFILAPEGQIGSALVDTVQELLDGPGGFGGAHRQYQPNEIAILARTWRDLDAAGAILSEAGITASPPTDDKRWWSTPAGQIALAVARVASKGCVDEHEASIILEGLGHQDPDGLNARLAIDSIKQEVWLHEAMDNDPVASAGLPDGWWKSATTAVTLRDLEWLLKGVKPHTGPEIMRAISAGMDKDSTSETGLVMHEMSIEDLLVWLASDEASVRFVDESSVILSTYHGMKGLEVGAVVIYGACNGMLPSPFDKTQEEVLESGRCLYVGMTRAIDDLRVIIPTTLRGKQRTPSPWLVMSGLVEES